MFKQAKAFFLGMLEFRCSFTTRCSFETERAYDFGRETAHRITFRLYDHA